MMAKTPQAATERGQGGKEPKPRDSPRCVSSFPRTHGSPSSTPVLPPRCTRSSTRSSRNISECGRPRTQILDITHGLTLLNEKALDQRGRLCVVSADAQQYYDSVHVPSILQRLNIHDEAFGRAIEAHQLRTEIRVQSGASSAIIGPRGIGGLTGSRVGIASGRVPVAVAIRDVPTKIRQHLDGRPRIGQRSAQHGSHRRALKAGLGTGDQERKS